MGIHYNSSKKNMQFRAIDCAALPEELLESELFGHEKGAFTGAIEKKDGLFKLANNGTIFLDEIGKAKKLHSKLLRVLEPNTREFKPIGSEKYEKFTGRIICATPEPLDKMVKANPPEFSLELFNRITEGGIIKLTPLCERKEDIIPLAEHLIMKFCNKPADIKKYLSQEAKQLLNKYEWPGNVRELENAIKSALILSDENELSPDDFDQIRGKVFFDSNEFTSGLHGKNLADFTPEKFVLEIKGKTINKLLMTEPGHDQNSLKEIVKTGLKIHYKLAGYNVTELAKRLGYTREYIYEYLPKWGFTGEEIKEILKKPDSTSLL